MNNGLTIRAGAAGDVDTICGIAESLGDWFTPSGVAYIRQDQAYQKCLIAQIEGGTVGFLSYFIYEGMGSLGWIGVAKPYFGKAVGSALVCGFEAAMKKEKIKTVQVKTLGESVDYPPYERTRAFYYKMGFKTHRVEQTDNPECAEELVLRKTLG